MTTPLLALVPAPELRVVLLDVREAPEGELVRVAGIVGEGEEEQGDVEEVSLMGVLSPGEVVTRKLYMWG